MCARGATPRAARPLRDSFATLGRKGSVTRRRRPRRAGRPPPRSTQPGPERLGAGQARRVRERLGGVAGRRGRRRTRLQRSACSTTCPAAGAEVRGHDIAGERAALGEKRVRRPLVVHARGGDVASETVMPWSTTFRIASKTVVMMRPPPGEPTTRQQAPARRLDDRRRHGREHPLARRDRVGVRTRRGRTGSGRPARPRSRPSRCSAGSPRRPLRAATRTPR